MHAQLLFFAMAPALAFAVVHRRGRLRAGVLVALAVAGVELAANSVAIGRVEPFSLASLILFALFGSLSLRSADARWFRLQPVALGLGLAAVFGWWYFVRGVPLFAVILDEYVRIHAVLPTYQHGYATLYATTLSRSLPFLLLVHAAWTGWAAWRRSTAVWIAVRVLGFYGLLALLFLAERWLQVQP